MNNFVTWSYLATFAGTLVMVLILTQLTKDIKFVKKVPTQLWSYVLALVVLYLSTYFTGKLTPDMAFLILFNAAIISLSANGGFQAIGRLINTATAMANTATTDAIQNGNTDASTPDTSTTSTETEKVEETAPVEQTTEKSETDTNTEQTTDTVQK